MTASPLSPRRLLDETAELQVRCALAVDARDWDRFENCFTPDMTAELPRTGSHRDRATMLSAVQATIGRLARTQHFVTNHTADEQEDGIVATCYVLAQHVGRDSDRQSQYLFGGRYQDRMDRIDGLLLIRHRRLEVFWASGDPGVLA